MAEKKIITKSTKRIQTTEELAEINSIISEILEEYRYCQDESFYIDETHNWGDFQEESEEYWHFVGKYD